MSPGMPNAGDGTTGIQGVPGPSPDELRSVASPARRRYLTILFSDLVGSTRLAGMMEAEDYAHLLNQLASTYQTIIPQFGGTVVQISGDGLLAIFGYPDASENDGRTAVMAALELHTRLRAFDEQEGNRSLRLHSGVHSGLVLLHEGDAVRGRFELLGGATNIASRLAQAAQVDEILVSEATLGPDHGAFLTSERLLLSLKGKEKPISAFRVFGRAPERTRFAARERGGLNPFVGRQSALQRLAEAADRVAAGGTGFVSVVGPPGIGKTRLIAELLSRAGDRFQVYRGECDSHLGAEPLQPFLQILRAVLGVGQLARSGRSVETIRDALGALGSDLAGHGEVLLGLLAPADARRSKAAPTAASVTAALRALFARLAGGAPLALFIDDWQWADDASRKLVQALREAVCPGLLVLLTMREEGATELFDDFDRLNLTPFTDEEAADAVRQALPGADPFLIGDICAAAGGNPLFIEELCHSAACGEQDFRTHGGSAWLDILIESRFARLPDEHAALLATAAVIGNIIPAWLLELTTGHGEGDPLIQALAQDDFIFPGDREGTLRFKHGITREVIYDSVGLRERRAMHLRIAEAFRQKGESEGEEEYYEALAYHYGAGGDPAASACYAERAGDKALARAAVDQAQRQYRAALDSLDRLPRTDEVSRSWQRVARRYGLAGVFDPSTDQLPVLERAVKRAAERGDALAEGLAEHWLGYIHYALGHAREAITHCERGLSAAISIREERLVAQIKNLLGESLALTSNYDAALAMLNAGISEMRRNPDGVGTPIGFAYALAIKGFVLADLGRFGEARSLFDEALAVVAGIEHPVEASLLSLYGVALVWQGHLEEALRIAAEAERVAKRIRTSYMFARSRAKNGYARWKMTGDSNAIEQLIEVTAWLEASEQELFLSLNYGWLAEIMAATGQADSVRRYAARALMRARRRHDRLGEAAAYRALASLAQSQSRSERADHYVERAMAAARARGSAHEIATTQVRAAEIRFARNERGQALALLDAAEAAFAQMGMRWHEEQVARLRAQAG